MIHLRSLYTTCLAILAMATALNAQSFRIHGTVREATTGDPIPAAQVRIQGSIAGTLTDSLGKYSLTTEAGARALEVTHIGYKKSTIPLATGIGFNELSLDIRMEPAPSWDPVIISAGPTTVLDDPTIHLYDYEMMDDRIMMIIYDRKLRRSKLAIVDERDSILDTELLPEEPGRLAKDCLGNIHAISQHYACQLFWNGGEIGYFQDTLPAFERAVTPCLGNIDAHYYYNLHTFNDQIVDFFAYNREEGEFTRFFRLRDSVRIHQLMDPFLITKFPADQQPSMMDMLVYGDEGTPKMGREPLWDDKHLFFQPIDAPLRVIDDQFYIFDHLHGRIRSFESSGKAVASLPVDYHKIRNRQKLIIVDEVQGDVYTAFEKHGYTQLRRIDMGTGTLSQDIDIPLQFPHKIQVHDGVAYFLYRQGHYDDTKRLYRMPL
jgi:hypothetical protein